MHEFASSQPNLRLLASLERARDIALALTAATATLVLATWLVPGLGELLPNGWWGMKANTAAGVLLLAAGMAAMRPGLSAAARTGGWAAGVTVAALAIWTLAEHAGVAPFAIDTWLAADPYSPHGGRPSIQTALTFLALALALPFLTLRKSPLAPVIDILVALALLGVLIFLAGYLFGAVLLFGQSGETRVAPHSLACLSLLVFAAAVGRVETGFYSVLVGIGIGSHIARRALPFALLLPFALDFASGYALLQGWIGLPYAAALASAFIALAFFLLVLAMAWRINGLEQELRAQSLTDPLTGLANRRGFELLGEHLWLDARRNAEPVAALFFDLDGLKAVNDTRGHDAGSQLIADMAGLLRGHFRANDIVARVGGDEFAVLTRGDAASLDAALERVNAARVQLNKKNPAYAVRYSVGSASAVPQGDTGFAELVARADTAMYADKQRRLAAHIVD